MTNTTKQEAQKLLKREAESIVDERVVPQTLDIIFEWTGELIAKMENAKAGDEKSAGIAYDTIQDGLIDETIKQLVEFKNKRNARK